MRPILQSSCSRSFNKGIKRAKQIVIDQSSLSRCCSDLAAVVIRVEAGPDAVVVPAVVVSIAIWINEKIIKMGFVARFSSNCYLIFKMETFGYQHKQTDFFNSAEVSFRHQMNSWTHAVWINLIGGPICISYSLHTIWCSVTITSAGGTWACILAAWVTTGAFALTALGGTAILAALWKITFTYWQATTSDVKWLNNRSHGFIHSRMKSDEKGRLNI